MFKELSNHIENNERIHIAVSGGVDSVALLYAITEMAPSDVEIIVHHVKHNVSKNTDAWAYFVKDLIQDISKPNVKLFLHNLHFESRSNFESVARQKRYNAIYSKMKKGEKLFLAHHADDQVENVLINLFKGRGLNGLTSLKDVNVTEDGYILVRPFLKTEKSTLENYLESKNAKHIHDESNDSINYDRNFVRNKIVPLLLKRFKNLKPSIMATYESLLSSKEALKELVEDKIANIQLEDGSVDLIEFNKMSFTVKREIVISLLRKEALFTYKKKTIDELINQAISVEKNGSMKANVEFYGDEYKVTFYFFKEKGRKILKTKKSLI